MPSSKDLKFRIRGLYIYLTILIIAAILVLTVGPALVARQYGYTWSLLIWIVPSVAITWWFVSSKDYEITKKRAFGWTVLYLFLNALFLEMFFAHHFFTFPDPSAVLGLYVPGFSLTEFRFVTDRPFPIEEFFFYLFGLICILLIYVWGDEYWFARYQPPDRKLASSAVQRLLGIHLRALLFGLIFLILATFLKILLNPSSHYPIPAYLAVQIVLALTPTVTLLKAVSSFVNWRAFSFTLVTTLLISLLYEVTLGIPGEWWGYQKEPMIGLFIASWQDLPIEAVLLWFQGVFMIVLVFEATKIYAVKRQTKVTQ